MQEYEAGNYDAIVIGAGHAGCEAALALSRMGQRTLCLCLSLDNIAMMPCNPAIGGTSKGHLVREVDALGGQMGITADECFIQLRMINTKKGPAVHSLRAQEDKRAYTDAMRKVMENQSLLDLRQAEGAGIITEGGRAAGVITSFGARFYARAVVIATGVYLNSRIITGGRSTPCGPSGILHSEHLAGSLSELGMEIRRFKTGTPPRIDGRTADYSKMEPQYGDCPVVPFSFLSEAGAMSQRRQDVCYLTYTNGRTHEILRENLSRSPMYSGEITGTGVRYCPSIEDKIVRFAHRERHQIFLEPEGRYTDEKYVQGFSTSMPEEIQQAALNTLPGLENARIVRPGYAIEYDCIDGRQLELSLMSKDVPGLFFAGQICGSSGYEEAAAQGIMAGINAALYLKGKPPLILSRSQAYIGVLIDDLVTKGTPEPYRMMTSRAEFRLILRQDNADLRLTEKGYAVGLATRERFERMMRKKQALEAELSRLESTRPGQEALTKLSEATGKDYPAGITLKKLLAHSEIGYEELGLVDEQSRALSAEVKEQVVITVRYEGYIDRQMKDVEKASKMEAREIPETLDYEKVRGLKNEARQKLIRIRPQNLGQASRITGVSPADIAVLTIFMDRMEERDVPQRS